MLSLGDVFFCRLLQSSLGSEQHESWSICKFLNPRVARNAVRRPGCVASIKASLGQKERMWKTQTQQEGGGAAGRAPASPLSPCSAAQGLGFGDDHGAKCHVEVAPAWAVSVPAAWLPLRPLTHAFPDTFLSCTLKFTAHCCYRCFLLQAGAMPALVRL